MSNKNKYNYLEDYLTQIKAKLIEAINILFVDIKIVKLSNEKLTNDLEKQKRDETRFKID